MLQKEATDVWNLPFLSAITILLLIWLLSLVVWIDLYEINLRDKPMNHHNQVWRATMSLYILHVQITRMVIPLRENNYSLPNKALSCASLLSTSCFSRWFKSLQSSPRRYNPDTSHGHIAESANESAHVMHHFGTIEELWDITWSCRN